MLLLVVQALALVALQDLGADMFVVVLWAHKAIFLGAYNIFQFVVCHSLLVVFNLHLIFWVVENNRRYLFGFVLPLESRFECVCQRRVGVARTSFILRALHIRMACLSLHLGPGLVAVFIHDLIGRSITDFWFVTWLLAFAKRIFSFCSEGILRPIVLGFWLHLDVFVAFQAKSVNRFLDYMALKHRVDMRGLWLFSLTMGW